MIRCNLSVIIAERNLKISKVAQDTKMSRTTVTSLAMNHAQGIQFDTLNKLCVYLKTTPNELISYLPVDVRLRNIDFIDGWHKGARDEDCTIRIWFEVSDRGYSAVGYLDAEMIVRRGEEALEVRVNVLESNPVNEEDKIQFEKFVKVFRRLTRPFMADIEESIGQCIIKEVEYEIPYMSCAVDWDSKYIGY